jgi:hypothetical protein
MTYKNGSGEALAENTTLELLDLSWNSFSGKGAVALIKGIQVIILFRLAGTYHSNDSFV